MGYLSTAVKRHGEGLLTEDLTVILTVSQRQWTWKAQKRKRRRKSPKNPRRKNLRSQRRKRRRVRAANQVTAMTRIAGWRKMLCFQWQSEEQRKMNRRRSK